jgi:gamma-glutamyltranspeptidase/glutathione hydrolase
MQPPGHVQILVNLPSFDMSLQEAGDSPRIHHVGSTEPTDEAADSLGGELQVESGLPPETMRELVRRERRITAAPASDFGGYQAIGYDEG